MAETPAKAPAVETAVFAIDAYATKERSKGLALKTVDGKRQLVTIDDAASRCSVIVEMVGPDKFSPNRFGGGWMTLLKVVPPDSAFAVKLREALQKAVQYVAVWDADKQEPTLMLATEAANLGLRKGNSSRVQGFRI